MARALKPERTDSMFDLRSTKGRSLKKEALLKFVSETFLELFACETKEEVGRTSLALAEKLTGSELGFISELNQSGLFDALAISNPGWDVCKMPDSLAMISIKNMGIRGIDRSTLKEKASRIVNDLDSHPDRVGTPGGHPQITSFLGVLLKHGEETLGMIGLANKERGYKLADQEAVEALSIAFVEVFRHKRTEEALRESEEFRSSLFKNSLHPILVIDKDTSIKYVNPTLEELTGYTAAEIIGKRVPYPCWTEEWRSGGMTEMEKNFSRRLSED